MHRRSPETLGAGWRMSSWATLATMPCDQLCGTPAPSPTISGASGCGRGSPQSEDNLNIGAITNWPMIPPHPNPSSSMPAFAMPSPPKRMLNRPYGSRRRLVTCVPTAISIGAFSCSGHRGYSRAVELINRQVSTDYWVTSVRRAGRPVLHLVRLPLADWRERIDYIAPTSSAASSSRQFSCSF